MDDEKHVEATASASGSYSSTSSSTRDEISAQKALEKRVVWKLDFRIIPLLWVLYLLNFIDRANIGNAKIQGMETELELIDHRFNIVVWVFNLGYLVAGIPLMIVFRKYGPKTLCVMMFFWGITVIGCGFVRTWQQLVICRLFMGIAEAAFIAGAAYLIGAYYTAEEYLTRFVLFCTAGIIAGAINGFLSSWIALMDGARGYGAWRWIFIVEGSITAIVGVMAWFIIVPWPEECTFLSQEEKECMLSRTREDGGHVNEDALTMSQARSRVWRLLKDPKIWLGIAMNLGATENANSLANFQPTIIRGLGHPARTAQLLTIPVYVWGAVFSVEMAYLSARLRQRYLFYLAGWMVLASGLIVEIVYPKNAWVRYMGIFFVASGCYLAMPISIVWISLNAGRGVDRAIAIGAIVNIGTAGAFISSNVFFKREEPRFRTGFSIGFGLSCMGALAATILYIHCKKRNEEAAKKDATAHEHGGDWEGPPACIQNRLAL